MKPRVKILLKRSVYHFLTLVVEFTVVDDRVLS